MGFFSWKTADTQQSIYNKFTDKCKPVYLLQPNGQPAIAEPEYEGYGVFGGIDTFVWLARTNFPATMTEGATDEELRRLGVAASFPLRSFVWDGRKHIYDFEEKMALILGIIHAGDDYVLLKFKDEWRNKEFDKPGMTSNQLQCHLDYPLKFSFNPNAVYEELAPSEECSNQGFFSSI